MISKKKIEFTKKEKRWYRGLLFFTFIIDCIVIGGLYVRQIENRVPGHIYLFQNQDTRIDFGAPLYGEYHEAKDVFCITNDTTKITEQTSFALDEPVSVLASKIGSYEAELKWFGLFHYKYIHFDVIEKEKVMPSGRTVGLYIQSDGIMVLGTAKIQGADGLSYEPAKDILQAGDTIQKVCDKPVQSIDDIVALVQKNESPKIKLQIKRNGNLIQVKLDSVKGKDGKNKLGIWLREDTEGIGTMSFVTRKNQFAALGHGITDIDTGRVVPLNHGIVYPATIEAVKKGKAGTPGELVGSVTVGEENRIGEIQSNTKLGITGSVDKEEYAYTEEDALAIGLKQEVKKGRAWILCQLGTTVEKYEIRIEEINLNSKDNKGMVVRITDRNLLKRSGGIVQGMSGAPIIQNNKVIGAVTHVFVNDPTGGYGTFIENML